MDRAIADQERFILRVDIQGMTEINRRYGLDYGDAVIDSTAQILRSVCAEGDQAARWSGDTFLVLGFGPSPDPTAFTDRVNRALLDSGIALGKLPVEVPTEVVAGRDESFQALLTRLIQSNVQGR